jgi:putative ABC transport system ATP-binding protein
VFIGELNLGDLDDRELTKLRRDRVGFIFQTFNLVPTLNAIENLTLPLDLAAKKVDPGWLNFVVDTLGIGDRLKHKPLELSGGQQQRVAVGRALVTRPAIIFGDEPTGNLDSRSSAEVMRLLRDAVTSLGQTVVIVTHDPIAAGYADRVVFLGDGRIVDELSNPTAQQIIDHMKREG